LTIAGLVCENKFLIFTHNAKQVSGLGQV